MVRNVRANINVQCLLIISQYRDIRKIDLRELLSERILDLLSENLVEYSIVSYSSQGWSEQ